VGADFPVVTVEDWVDAQARLLDRLGIAAARRRDRRQPRRHAGAVAGRCATRSACATAVAIATRAEPVGAEHRLQRGGAPRHRHRPRLPRRALLRATAPCRGAACAWRACSATSPTCPTTRWSRSSAARCAQAELAYSTQDIEFQIESYLRHQGDKFSEYFDANTYLLITRALDYFDPARRARRRPGARPSPPRARAATCSVSFSTDWRFSPARSREIVKALVDNRIDVSYAEIDAPHGHDAFLLDDARYHRCVGAYFGRIAT
jgi:homoserine O-acetyltransferase